MSTESPNETTVYFNKSWYTKHIAEGLGQDEERQPSVQRVQEVQRGAELSGLTATEDHDNSYSSQKKRPGRKTAGAIQLSTEQIRSGGCFFPRAFGRRGGLFSFGFENSIRTKDITNLARH